MRKYPYRVDWFCREHATEKKEKCILKSLLEPPRLKHQRESVIVRVMESSSRVREAKYDSLQGGRQNVRVIEVRVMEIQQ